LEDACVGDPDVREDYDLGEKNSQDSGSNEQRRLFPYDRTLRFKPARLSVSTQVLRELSGVALCGIVVRDGGGVLGLGEPGQCSCSLLSFVEF